MIILKHIDHGTHFANHEMEAQECERNGWVRVENIYDNPFIGPIEIPGEPEVSEASEAQTEVPHDPKMGKFDRKAHMKKMWAEGKMKKKSG